MAPRSVAEVVGAVAAPLPYTIYAARRGRPYLCWTLRRHRVLFLVAWVWFAWHVLVKGSKRVAIPKQA